MERDEFEEFVDDHVDEAIERIEGGPRPLRLWIKLLAASLLHLTEDVAESNEPLTDTTDDDDDNLDVLSDDEEEDPA